MKISNVLINLIGARDSNCPNEADVLAYSEHRLSTGDRTRIERHFANCDDCRHVLACLGREVEPAAAFTEEALSDQTQRVLAYIQRDERSRANRRPQKARAAAGGFYLSYPKLAAVGLIVCAIAVAGVSIITRDQSPADAAMAALRMSVKDARLTEPRISGGFDHSRYVAPTRGSLRGGPAGDDDINLGRAQNKVQEAAERDTSAVKTRLVLARVYLAKGTRDGAAKALAILNQIGTRGVETDETLNDTGVAQFLLDYYGDAIGSFSKALAKSPGYHEALFNKALAEQRDHREEDARGDWLRFIDQSSDESWKAEARMYLGLLEPTSSQSH